MVKKYKLYVGMILGFFVLLCCLEARDIRFRPDQGEYKILNPIRGQLDIQSKNINYEKDINNIFAFPETVAIVVPGNSDINVKLTNAAQIKIKRKEGKIDDLIIVGKYDFEAIDSPNLIQIKNSILYKGSRIFLLTVNHLQPTSYMEYRYYHTINFSVEIKESDGQSEFRGNIPYEVSKIALNKEFINNLEYRPSPRPEGPRRRSFRYDLDYLIISPQAFIETAQILLTHRKKQGVKGEIFGFKDLSELTSGEQISPETVKEFISSVYLHNNPANELKIVLIGDALEDYSSYGMNSGLYLPTYKLKYEKLGIEYASDNWYGCIIGEDSLPEVIVGRLPVRSKEQLENIIEKIITFEQVGSVNNRTLVIADDGDRFKRPGEFTLNYLKENNFDADKIFLDDFSIPDGLSSVERVKYTNTYITPCLFDAFNEGLKYVMFYGHGGIRVWTHEEIFDSRVEEDMFQNLIETQYVPIVFSYSCLNGYFDKNEFPCIAERMLQAENRGAVAFLTSSQEIDSMTNRNLSEKILDLLTDDEVKTIGDILIRLKLDTLLRRGLDFDYVNNSFLLFGDPAMRVK